MQSKGRANMNKKVLITGGSHSEIPLIKSLHKLGYYVISTGNDRGASGHLESDEYIAGDYSNKDFVLDLARSQNVSGIVSGCNDFAYISTAYACEKLNLPGHDSYENALKIHHKNQFRNLMQECKIPTPKDYLIASIEELDSINTSLHFPVIVKPVDLTGGNGICKCNSHDELVKALSAAFSVTRESKVLIEEFIEGTNHGASFLIRNQKVIFSFFDNEQYFLNKYLVAGASYPAAISEECKNSLISYVETIAKKAELADGLFHTQCIVSNDGVGYIIDPCRRTPGDLYIRLVELSTGVNYPEYIVRAELSDGYKDIIVSAKNNRIIARECLMAQKNGIYKKTNISKEYNNKIIESMILHKAEEEVIDYLKFKSEIIFLESDSVEEQKQMLAKLYDNVELEVV